MITHEPQVIIPQLTAEDRKVLATELRALNALKIEKGIAAHAMTRETVKVYSKRAGGMIERPRRLGAHAGQMVRQLVHWEGKGEAEDFSIHKTKREWEEEIGLSRSNLETATRRLVAEGLLTTRPDYRKGDRRPTTYYTLNLWAVMRLLDPVRAVEIEPELHGLEPETEAERVEYDDLDDLLDLPDFEDIPHVESETDDVRNGQRTCPEPTGLVSKTDRVAVGNGQVTREYPQSTAEDDDSLLTESSSFTTQNSPCESSLSLLPHGGNGVNNEGMDITTSAPISAREGWAMFKRGEVSMEELTVLLDPTKTVKEVA